MLILLLRGIGIIRKSDAPFISRLTVDVVLPALLVSKLVFVKIDATILLPCLQIVFSEFLIGIAAYFSGKYILRLERPSLGVFILCCAFGSTAILGTAYITAIFNGNDATIAHALLIAEISNGIPGYIFLYVISKRFGDNSFIQESMLKRFFSIALSPPVAAIILSLTWSGLEFPTEGVIITPLINAANYVGSSLVLMIALLNGLAIGPMPIRNNIPIVFLCITFVLIIKPLIVYEINGLYDLALQDRQISVIESAMPSANAVIAYAIRYNCDQLLAAVLVTSTAIIGAFTLPFLMQYLKIFI
jgi:predicted permease